MGEVSMIAVDLAKRVFQVHGVDAAGVVCLKKRLRRQQLIEFFSTLPRCIIGMEACATAHYWARHLQALGHEVRLVPPIYVKPYVQRQKNDAADAAAICEAMSRPSMRFVPAKTEDQQATQVGLRTRDLLVRQRTMTINALRGHLAEFGITGAVGRYYIGQLCERIADPKLPIPEYVRDALLHLVQQIESCDRRIAELDVAIARRCRSDEMGQRLLTVPGIGAITASAIMAAAPDPTRFKSGRHFAAWLGLVPLQKSSGEKKRIGHLTKMGDRTLRRLLVNSAMSCIIAERRRARYRAFEREPLIWSSALRSELDSSGHPHMTARRGVQGRPRPARWSRAGDRVSLMTDVIMIPLTKLIESEDNVRRSNRKGGVAELAASVKALGLLQSLVVKDTGNGKFAVIAGGRRLRALRMLSKAGDIEKNAPIPCRVISCDDNPTELSLAENVTRLDARRR